MIAALGVVPFGFGLLTTHAPRWAIQESSLGIPHREVAIEHRGRPPAVRLVRPIAQPHRRAAQPRVRRQPRARGRHVRMLARHGYGVLALDNPGNGESEGHSNGLGDNAQPGIDAALGWLSPRPDVDPSRIAASAPRSAARWR